MVVLWISNYMVVSSNLGLSKIVFFLLKLIYGMNVKSLKN